MSNAHLFYPNCISSIRVDYILDNRTFIEDTAYFNVKSNINYLIKTNIKLFKGLNIDLKCMCEYGNDELRIGYNFKCGNCRTESEKYKNWEGRKVPFFPIRKIPFFPNGVGYIYETVSCCQETCLCIVITLYPYYRESDFIPREPYRDPNAPIAAAFFAGFFGTAAAVILGPAAIPVIGLAGWTAATGLSATAVLTGVLGGGGAISSYFATLNSSDGKICINMPTINIGNCNGRDVNEIGVPIYLKASDYQQFDTNMTKSDLINKINNHPITALITQYPRLFKKI